MKNLMFASLLFLSACCSLPEQWVRQSRANYDTLAPRVEKLMETSDHYDEEQEQDIRDRLTAWDYRIKQAEALLDEQE